jgi:hypothetical protein
LWHAADQREADKINAEDTLIPLPLDNNGRPVRPPNAIVLKLLRVREYKWKLDKDIQMERWLECTRFFVMDLKIREKKNFMQRLQIGLC